MTTDGINAERLDEKTRVAADISYSVGTAGAIMIGDRLGLYAAMAGAGPVTSIELAERAGVSERYVREWLFQQTAAKILEVHPPDRFELTAEAALVFASHDNPASQIGSFSSLPGRVATYESAMEAFRTGIGRPRRGSASGIERGALQAWSRSALVPLVLPQLGDVVQRLEAGGAVADIGCGGGAAPLAIAHAFPQSTVHGFDTWTDALDVCERLRIDACLSNVSFHHPDVRPLPTEPTYDLMLTMDVLHDLPRPDVMARAVRDAIKDDGYWFIVETEAAEDPLENIAKPSGRFGYAASMMVCLQSSTAEPGGWGLGTFGLYEGRLRELVTEAGFTSLERVPGLVHRWNAYWVVRP